MNLQSRIRSLLYSKQWKIYTYKSNSGSRYFHITKGYRNAIIRIADHPQKKKKKYRKKALFSFHPGSTDTLSMLIKFLDGTITIERKIIMSKVANYLKNEFERQEVTFKEDVMQVFNWFYETIKNALTKELASKVTLEEFLDILDNLYEQYVQPIDLPGSDILLDPIIKKAFKALGKYLYDKVINAE